MAHSKFVNEDVKLRLFESFALPLLTLWFKRFILSGTQLSKLNSGWNNVYRKIFGMKPWESVKEMHTFCGRLDLKLVIDLNKMKFLNNVSPPRFVFVLYLPGYEISFC